MNDKYVCKCCGGKINRSSLTCEYCGTQYEDYGNVIRIETFNNPIKTLACRTVMPRVDVDYMGEENASLLMRQQIVKNLSDALADVMAYQIEYDPCYQQYKMSGTIKAVIPINKGGEFVCR